MRVAILGFDTEGRVSFEYYRSHGHEVTICDQKTDIGVPEGVDTQLGEGYLDNLDRFDLLIRTPGMHPSTILEKNPGVADKIWSGTNEFLKVSPSRNIIGVTGTKGKGTTSTLITKILEAAGKTVHLAGNIGRAALDVLPEVKPDDWVVLELSNFQLIDLKSSPHLAVCLLVVSEHLDWHKDEQEYQSAKTNLFRYQNSDDVAIYYAKNPNSEVIASAGSGALIPYFAAPGALVEDGLIRIADQDICRTDDLKLLGEHNWQNACAAVTTVWQITQDLDAIRSVLTSFSGLPHRIEFVREKEGVRFYNDSFATGLHATEAALSAVPKPIVAIIGGFDRMLPLEHFAEFVRNLEGLKRIVLVGASAERVQAALDKAGFANYTISDAKDMQQIVADVLQVAEPGDSVLFSPGFASFDMFKNFSDRGDQFRAHVQAL